MAHLCDDRYHLTAGEEATHAGFRPLSDLDLDHPTFAQIRRRDAEPPRGELMALRIRIFAAGEYLEAVGGNTAFAGADRTAHQVKGDGHVAVRRVADRAE